MACFRYSARLPVHNKMWWVRFAKVGNAPLRFATVRFRSVRFGSVWFASLFTRYRRSESSLQFGPVRSSSVRFAQVRFHNAQDCSTGWPDHTYKYLGTGTGPCPFTDLYRTVQYLVLQLHSTRSEGTKYSTGRLFGIQSCSTSIATVVQIVWVYRRFANKHVSVLLIRKTCTSGWRNRITKFSSL